MTPTRLLAAVLALAGCSAVVPSTAARLAAFDPLTVDPAGIEMMVILPPGLAASPGSARLDLSASRGTEKLNGSFVLADLPAAAGPDLAEGTTARRFVIASAEVPRMRALQAEIAAWKREGEAKGALAVGIGGCATGDGPAADATGSILIRMTAGGPYLPLIANGRLADLLGPETLASLRPCQAVE